MAIKGGEAKSLYNVLNESCIIKYYKMPEYQREYIWSNFQIEQLITDIDENDEGHFLGTIILYTKTDKEGKKEDNEIIDGQQRLITLSLLLGSLHKKINDLYENELKQELPIIETNEKKRQGIFKNIVVVGRKIEEVLICNKEPKLMLDTVNKNNDKYKHFLFSIKLLETDTKVDNYGNTKFAHNIKYIEDILNNITNDTDKIEDKINKLIAFINKVLSVYIAPISTTTYSDAYKLFECINNRGVELSAIDIIKNLVFKEYTSKPCNTINTINETWQNILNNLGDANNQTRFLRQYYNAFQYKVEIKQNSIAKATGSNIARIYEQLIRKDVDLLISEFTDKSGIYALLTQDELMNKNLKKDLIRLKQVSFAPAYTFLMYLFNKTQNEDLQKDVISFFVKFAFRRNLTDYPKTRNLDQMFMDLIKQCEESNEISFDLIKNFLLQPKYFSPFTDVIKYLSGNIYEDNVDLTRFILCEIQNKLHGEDMPENPRPNVWNKEDNKYVFEIEHILPQTGNLQKNNWVDMIANGNIEEAERVRSLYKHRIGNLTLSAYNQKLSTFSFEKKRDRYDEKNGRKYYIGYKNGLAINEDLKNEDIWNKDKIKIRSIKLIKHALDLFKIEGEEIPEDEKLFVIQKDIEE